MAQKRRILIIVGPTASGKDTAGDMIAEILEAPHQTTSAILQDLCQERGLELTRSNLIDMANEMAAQYDDAILAKLALEAIDGPIGVISGIRQLEQIDYLREHAVAPIVSVDAPAEVRLQRARNRSDKPGPHLASLEAFLEHEQQENAPPNTQRVFECMYLADYVESNNGTLEDLRDRMRLLANTLQKSDFFYMHRC